MTHVKTTTDMEKQSLLKEKASSAEPTETDLQFETDWQNAISGDEFVRRVHQHIDKLYAE